MAEHEGAADRGMVDADDFLGFATRLREVHGRVDGAKVSREQRGRWQRKLIMIADVGHRDLGQASELLRRFESELDRRS
ncbi:MAG: hypothetical protein KY461_05150 [Actinobacteria bacterium]|nr:hypothetical protein [Actinomycetota bacterium]